MKKLIFLSIALLSFIAVKAQVTTNLKPLQSDLTIHVAGLDTVINAGTKSQKITIAGWQEVTTFQVVVTKISGTVGGTISLQGSLDGINWVTIGSTVTPTNVALQTFSFSVNPSIYPNYQISYTGVTGPMTAQINSYAMWRKRPTNSTFPN